MKSMKYKNNPALVEVSRKLRRNMTSEESRLWYHFPRNYPVKILRHKIIDYYIADFYCSSAQLAIGIDGIQHYTPEGMEHDKVRTEMIELMLEYGIYPTQEQLEVMGWTTPQYMAYMANYG